MLQSLITYTEALITTSNVLQNMTPKIFAHSSRLLDDQLLYLLTLRTGFKGCEQGGKDLRFWWFTGKNGIVTFLEDSVTSANDC